MCFLENPSGNLKLFCLLIYYFASPVSTKAPGEQPSDFFCLLFQHLAQNMAHNWYSVNISEKNINKGILYKTHNSSYSSIVLLPILHLGKLK